MSADILEFRSPLGTTPSDLAAVLAVLPEAWTADTMEDGQCPAWIAVVGPDGEPSVVGKLDARFHLLIGEREAREFGRLSSARAAAELLLSETARAA